VTGMYALYPDGASAQEGVDRLRGIGIAETDIVVISATPLDDVPCGHLPGSVAPRTLWRMAFGGGLLGLAGGTWLTRGTQLAWPLATGGMPIVSWWTNLIVMFELTMLGAIAATVVTFVAGARLLRPACGLYDSAIARGQILVGIERLHRPELEVAQALSSSAAVVVHRVELDESRSD
jgi:hypothetical protein